MSSSSPPQDTFQRHRQVKLNRNSNIMTCTKQQPLILHMVCSSNSQQPCPERIIELDPAGHPVIIGRASAADKESKDYNNPESAKFVCSVMSRNHAQLTWIRNRIYLQDTGSTHGTWYMPSQTAHFPGSSSRNRSSRQNTRSMWEKIPNQLHLHDGMSIRFGRAITNPLNGSRHTPLQVTFRIPPRTNTPRSGTYGLNGSQYLDSSDESEAEEENLEDARSTKIGTTNRDSSRVTVASNKESSQAHPNPPKSPCRFEVPSKIVEAVPAKTHKTSKRSTLVHGPSKFARPPDHHPSQPSKKSGHPGQSLNDSLPPPYDDCQSPDRFEKDPSGNPPHSTKTAEPNDSHLDKSDGSSSNSNNGPSNSNNGPNGRKHQEALDNMQGSKPLVSEKGSSRVTKTSSDIAASLSDIQAGHGDGVHETLDVEQKHNEVSVEQSDMEADGSNIEDKRSRLQVEESDLEEGSEDEEDSQEILDDQETSRDESLQVQVDHAQRPQNTALDQNDEENPRHGVADLRSDQNPQSSHSSLPNSTAGLGSLATNSEEDKEMKKQKSYLLNRPTYKDVSVVTTITSKTHFTESLNRLPDSLERTFQVSLKLKPPHFHPSLAETHTKHHASNRLPIVQTLSKKSPRLSHLVQSGSRNVHQPNQIPPTEHPSASYGPQSPVVPNDGPMITSELKRKRSPLVEGEEEDEEESIESEVMAEREKSIEEELDEKRLKKRVKLDASIVCSHCSKEMSGVKKESMRRKLRSHALSAARSVAIFALGGVATVAGILAFENILDEQ